MANIFPYLRPDSPQHVEAMRNIRLRQESERKRAARSNTTQEQAFQHELDINALREDKDDETATDEIRSRIYARSRGNGPELRSKTTVVEALQRIIKDIENEDIEVRGSLSDIEESRENQREHAKKWSAVLEAIQLGIKGDALNLTLEMVEYELGLALFKVKHAHNRKLKKNAERLYADLTVVRNAVLGAYLDKSS
ncbi:MAG: hypothetical protein WC477_00495 [Patescibacteria group bacterium]